MAQIVELRSSEKPGESLRPLVEALRQGALVAIPTETVYGIAACVFTPEAVERLDSGKGREPGKPLTLAVSSAEEALAWVPAMSSLGRRLAQRTWPGPVTLVFRGGFADGLLARIPERVRRRLCPGDTLGLRVPDHPVAREILALAGPLVLTSANRSGQPPACTADEAIRAMGDDLAWVVDDGPSHYGQASTVVLIDGDNWKILRQGVVSAAEISEQAACRILFVCTGNTCRSPMAAGLCRMLLARRLGCSPEELLARGYFVHSAGLSAVPGSGAAVEAVQAAREAGADLTTHETTPLTQDLIERADHVIVMTHNHLHAVVECFSGACSPPRLLSSEGEDLSDPIGYDQDVYRECAREIVSHLERLVPELMEKK